MKGARFILAVLVTSCLAILPACNRAEQSAPDPQVESSAVESTPDLPQQVDSSTAHQPPKAKGSARRAEADKIFAEHQVFRIDIQIPRAGMNALARTAWGNGRERPEAKAIVREGGVIYENVAVHLKGSAGSFQGIDGKPALTLKFDKFVPEQDFHGLNKISLNNSAQDSSFLCEKISRELMIAAGVPVPRAAHALVTLNGRDLGLYVLLEGANKRFLKRYFDNPDGNLYDGGFCQDLNNSLSVNCGENPSNRAALKQLVSVVRQGSPSFERLNQVLDTDRFLSMLALEVMLCHWDGYTMNRNNWRVFHDLGSNRMVFIPHGMDQLFGRGRPADDDDPTKPRHLMGDVSQKILATREGQQRYRGRVGYLYTNVFMVEGIGERIDEISAAVAPAIAQSHAQIAAQFQRQASQLKRRIVRRGDVLARHFGPAAPPTEFGPEGVLQLAGWKPSVHSGNPTLSELQDPSSGKPVLSILAGPDGTSSSTYRTRVVLGPGRYQLEGRILLKGVFVEQGDTIGGADLRISKGTLPKKLTGNTTWTDYRYPFSVAESAADVELICELRASKGEVWFDRSSLRLVRLE